MSDRRSAYRKQLAGQKRYVWAADGILLLLHGALLVGEWCLWRQWQRLGIRPVWFTLLPLAAVAADALLFSPLYLWRAEVCVNILDDKANTFTDLLQQYKPRRYGRIVAWRCMSLFFAVITALVCGLPPTLFALWREAVQNSGEAAVVQIFGEALQLLLWMLCILFWMLWQLRCFPAPYYLAVFPALTAVGAMRLACSGTRRRVSECALCVGRLVLCQSFPLLLYRLPVHRLRLAVCALTPSPSVVGHRFFRFQKRDRKTKAATG